MCLLYPTHKKGRSANSMAHTIWFENVQGGGCSYVTLSPYGCCGDYSISSACVEYTYCVGLSMTKGRKCIVVHRHRCRFESTKGATENHAAGTDRNLETAPAPGWGTPPKCLHAAVGARHAGRATRFSSRFRDAATWLMRVSYSDLRVIMAVVLTGRFSAAKLK